MQYGIRGARWDTRTAKKQVFAWAEVCAWRGDVGKGETVNLRWVEGVITTYKLLQLVCSFSVLPSFPVLEFDLVLHHEIVTGMVRGKLKMDLSEIVASHYL